MSDEEEEEETYDEEEEEEEEDDEDELTVYDEEGSVGDIVPDIEEEEEEVDHTYKTKFKEDMRNKYIEKFHPEEIHKSFEEINQLSIVERNAQGTIIDLNHITYPILSKYEKTKIIGLRVCQLNKGADPYIKLEKRIIDNTLIAEKELREKKLPFIIMRPLPNGFAEYWNINDLEFI